jgi:hypothetical protein
MLEFAFETRMAIRQKRCGFERTVTIESSPGLLFLMACGSFCLRHVGDSFCQSSQMLCSCGVVLAVRWSRNLCLVCLVGGSHIGNSTVAPPVQVPIPRLDRIAVDAESRRNL